MNLKVKAVVSFNHDNWEISCGKHILVSKSKSTALFLASWKKRPNFTLIEEPKWKQHFGGFPYGFPYSTTHLSYWCSHQAQLFTWEAATIRQQHQAAVGYGIMLVSLLKWRIRHQRFTCESFAVDCLLVAALKQIHVQPSPPSPHDSAKKGMAEKGSLITDQIQVLQFLLKV